MTLHRMNAPAASTEYSFSHYISSALQLAASARWPRRYEIIDQLVQIYQEQRRNAAPGDTRIERELYALLTDRSQDAAVHQMILLTTARFTQIERGDTVESTATAFNTVDVPASTSTRRTRALLDRRRVRRDATVHNLLPAALALYQQDPELLRQTLAQWQARGGDVAQIARDVQNALEAGERRRAHGRSVRRLFGVLAWIAVLLAPLFLTMVICANLYTDHFLLFLRHTIY